MPLKHRPEEVKQWVKNGRRTRIKFKEVTDLRVALYYKKWLLWWSEINPDCRTLCGGQLTQEVIDDWSPLALPGTNGLINVVAGLLLYREAAGPNDWMLSAEDVCWTFEQVLAYLTNPASGKEVESATYVLLFPSAS